MGARHFKSIYDMIVLTEAHPGQNVTMVTDQAQNSDKQFFSETGRRKTTFEISSSHLSLISLRENRHLQHMERSSVNLHSLALPQ